MSLPPTFDARLVRSTVLTPSVRELIFDRVDGQPMVFEPGQWLSLELALREGEPPIKRSYSIASAPDGSPRFEIAVTHVQGGPGSAYLHTLPPGAIVQAMGPQGFFTRGPTEASGRCLMIATGTGVTPMRSMLRSAFARDNGSAMYLVLGVRHEQDLLYADEFREAARAHPLFRFEPTISQPHGDWAGRRGYVQTHVRALWEQLVTLGEGLPHAYICGLEKMVGSVRELLRKEMGIPRQHVHSERYD